jgi:hypothetical protein
MPWCEDCNHFWNPPSMGAGGECPTCGKVIAPPRSRVPWHFKLLLVGIVVYLGYRMYQLVFWLVHHL